MSSLGFNFQCWGPAGCDEDGNVNEPVEGESLSEFVERRKEEEGGNVLVKGGRLLKEGFGAAGDAVMSTLFGDNYAVYLKIILAAIVIGILAKIRNMFR